VCIECRLFTRGCPTVMVTAKLPTLNLAESMRSGSLPLPTLRCIALDAETRLTALLPPRGPQHLWKQRVIGIVSNVIFKLKQPGSKCRPRRTRSCRNATLVVGNLNDLTHIGVSMKAD